MKTLIKVVALMLAVYGASFVNGVVKYFILKAHGIILPAIQWGSLPIGSFTLFGKVDIAFGLVPLLPLSSPLLDGDMLYQMLLPSTVLLVLALGLMLFAGEKLPSVFQWPFIMLAWIFGFSYYNRTTASYDEVNAQFGTFGAFVFTFTLVLLAYSVGTLLPFAFNDFWWQKSWEYYHAGNPTFGFMVLIVTLFFLGRQVGTLVNMFTRK